MKTTLGFFCCADWASAAPANACVMDRSSACFGSVVPFRLGSLQETHAFL
jgi:hypothetical protein